LGDRLAARYPDKASRIIEITNGYDPDDLKSVAPAEKPPGVRRIVYSGSLFAHHRDVLDSVLRALLRLGDQERQTLDVVFVGQAYDGAAREAEALGLGNTVRFTGYLPHGEALAMLMSADASLLLVRAGDRASVTGKVFELLGARRPILAAVEPEGECARILRLGAAAEWIAPPDDPAAIADRLHALISAGFPPLEASSVEQFSRARHAKVLASVFDAATA
jgi:glycosyltransferase involved in cell wall biosynthesis